MVVRTVGAVVTLLIGLGGVGSQVWAQYYPPPRAYPPPQAYPPAQDYPPYRPLPPVDADDDEGEEPIYDSPVQTRPLPPPGGTGAQVGEPLPAPGYRYGSRAPVYPEQADPPAPPSHRYGGRSRVYPDQAELPPAGGYRDLPPPGYPPPGYRDGAPGYREGAPGYRDGPPPGYRDGAQAYEPAAPGTRPQYPQSRDYPPNPVPGLTAPAGAGVPVDLDGLRPPMPISPGQAGPNQAGPVAPGQAGLAPMGPGAMGPGAMGPGAMGHGPVGHGPVGPAQASPGPVGPGSAGPAHAVGPGAIGADHSRMAALPPEVRPETGPVKQLPPQFRRTLVDYRTKEPAGTIIIDTQNTYLYSVLGNGKAMRYGIGVGREGFTWSGTEKVSKMAEWPDWNPPTEMIERQPYLPRFMAGGDGNPLGARALYLGKTLYRIHGTNQPSTIGSFVSSGCIRLTNEDITDLYTRVKVGTRVVVLPGRPPATAAATPRPMGPPGAPPVSMAPPSGPPGPIAR